MSKMRSGQREMSIFEAKGDTLLWKKHNIILVKEHKSRRREAN